MTADERLLQWSGSAQRVDARILCVRKTESEDTTILTLDRQARREEIARMLAGAEVSEKTRQYADALLAEAG